MASNRTEKEKRKKAGPIIAFFGLGALAAGLLFSFLKPKPPAETTLSGRVTDDATGLPMPGVPVMCNGSQVYTDNNGDYAFAPIEPGTYTVIFEMEGYARLEKTDVIVAKGAKKLDIVMVRLYLPVIDSVGISLGLNRRRMSAFGVIQYATYLKQVDTAKEVFIAMSTDKGGSWQSFQVTGSSTPGPGDKGNPGIAVDNNGDLCLVYRYGQNVYFDVLSTSAWLGPQQVNDLTNDNCAGGPELVIDKLNKPHVFYLSDRGAGFGDWGKCYVRHAENPPIWSKTDFAGTGVGGGGAAVVPGRFAIAINGSNQIEFIWHYGLNGGAGVGWMYRCTYKGSKPDAGMGGNELDYPDTVDIVLDSADNILLQYKNLVRFYGAALGPAEPITNTLWSVSIAADRENNLNVIWSQGGTPKYPSRRNLWYRKRSSGPAGTWTDPAWITDVEDDNDSPSMLWAKNPSDAVPDGYAVCWLRVLSNQYIYGSPDFFRSILGRP